MKVGGREIEISNLDKVLFPDAGITKGDLVDYYRRIAKTMLPHIENRPLTLHRFPDGIGAKGFYQQNASDYFPDWIVRATLPKENGKVEHCLCNNAATLVYLAGQACITPHSWLARAGRPDHPDRMIFDLDPSDDNFDLVRFGARTIHEVLDDVGLANFVMTTGSRGLHVMVPLDASADFDAVRNFARRVAEIAAAWEPDRLTMEQRKNKRGKRLYLDIMRNAYGQTAVTPYAVRAKPGAPVSMPLEWSELDGKLRPDKYRIENVFRRLARKKDPWRTMGRHAAALGAHEADLSRLEQDKPA
ncbi:MAG: non-homologous end-joining DNA ligase [Gammaproteobacteria bacterium]